MHQDSGLDSGVPRILEWGGGLGAAGAEVGRGQGVCPSPLREGSGEGLCLLPGKFFVFLVENVIFWCILTRYFLNHKPMGGVLTPLTPFSVRHWDSTNVFHGNFTEVTLAEQQSSIIMSVVYSSCYKITSIVMHSQQSSPHAIVQRKQSDAVISQAIT